VDGDVVAFRLLPASSWPAMSAGDEQREGDADETAESEAPYADGAEDGEFADDDAPVTLAAVVSAALGALRVDDTAAALSGRAAVLAAAAAAARGPPARRALGEVVAIVTFSPRRDAVVGYLEAPAGFGSAASPAAGGNGDVATPNGGGGGASPSTPGARGGGRGRGRGGRGAAATPPTPATPLSPATPPGAAPSPGGGGGMQWRFMPADARLPYCNVLPADVPAAARSAAMDGSLPSLLFLGRITRWAAASPGPLGAVRACLGSAGDIEAETAALVAEHGLDDTEFDAAALACLPPSPWSIPAAELAARRDLRGERIFSVDPPSARDLDDALSIQRVTLPGSGAPGWRVGVHIADVAAFVAPGSALDAAAAARATSSYLTQRVLPMLPRLLCDQLCSLQPGCDRLAFSIEWHLDDQARVVSEWAGRTVIRSAAKLAYAHAQAVIDAAGPDAEALGADAAAAALAGVALTPPHDAAGVAADVLALNRLARRLRAARIADGSLRLDHTKLHFALDAATGEPLGAAPYLITEAHSLIEEFMLLANRRVAATLASAFPERALLRRHPPPEPRKLAELAAFSSAHGLALACGGGSGALAASLKALAVSRPDATALATLLATKPQQLAQYFCTGQLPEEAWGHYALAMPRYTHFTSPIRRYADVIVHRQLAAALAATEADAAEAEAAAAVAAGRPDADAARARAAGARAAATAAAAALPGTEALGAATAHCNERKAAAKAAQEASARVFLCALLRRCRVVTSATVLATGRSYLHAYLEDLGFEARISLEAMPSKGVTVTADSTTVTLSRRDGKGSSRMRSAAPAAANAAGGPLRALALACAADGDAPAQALPQPAALPLRISPFSRVPVVLSASLGDGKRSEVVATLFLAGDEV
jgi:DIS3-like exonuclease 2